MTSSWWVLQKGFLLMYTLLYGHLAIAYLSTRTFWHAIYYLSCTLCRLLF